MIHSTPRDTLGAADRRAGCLRVLLIPVACLAMVGWWLPHRGQPTNHAYRLERAAGAAQWSWHPWVRSEAPEPLPQATAGTAAPSTTQPTVRAAQSPPRAARPTGSRQACILSRENHNDPTGNPYARSTNRTHFGAYQFDKDTWAAAGGDPAKWGSASPAEQDAAFNNYVSKYGYGAWAPYDGC